MNASPDMFNSTHPSKKPKPVTFFVNPLHMVCERNINGPGGEQSRYVSGPGMYDSYACFDVRLGLIKAEKKRTHIYDYDHVNLEKKNLITHYFRNYLSWSSKNPILVLITTFIYSVNIAVNPTLRKKFYTHYSGRVPAMTQFLLNTIRLGQLPDGNSLNEIQLNPIYNCPDLSEVPYWLKISAWIKDHDSKEFLTMCEWFAFLDQHLSDSDFWFSHFVRLKPTPLVSDKALTVTGFAKGYRESSATIEQSRLKDVYMLLNKALDFRTLEPEIVAQGVKTYLELDELSDFPDQLTDYPEDNYDPDYIEYDAKLGTELIGFIAGCRPQDLEVES